MSDMAEVVKSVVSGVLTGGASVVTTVFAVFRDFRVRLKAVEDKIGTDTEPRSGIYLLIWGVGDEIRRVKREIQSWEDDAPDWAKRLMRSRNSTIDLNAHLDFESRVETRLRQFQETLRRFESDLESAEAPDSKLLTRKEYLDDSKERGNELLKIRQELATVNGLLRGVMAAMGYLDTDKKDPRTR
jgi:hypothetical protein